MSNPAEEFLAHIERELGPCTHASSWRNPSGSLGIHILEFQKKPFGSSDTHVTFGLSTHDLASSETTTVRQEFLLTVHSRFRRWKPEEGLAAVAHRVLAAHSGVHLGDVLGPAGPIFEQPGPEAFYARAPRLFSTRFHVYDKVQPPIGIVWMVPVFASEAAFIRENGSSAFEGLLSERNPDLLDLERKPIL